MTGSSQQTPEEAMAPDVIKAEAEKNTNLQKHSAYMQELRTISSSYNAELLYSKRMTELQTNLEQENKQLQIDIDNIIGPTRTDDRRMVYETHESAHLLWIRKIFVLIYYLILLIYLFTSRFFLINSILNGEHGYISYYTYCFRFYLTFSLGILSASMRRSPI